MTPSLALHDAVSGTVCDDGSVIDRGDIAFGIREEYDYRQFTVVNLKLDIVFFSNRHIQLWLDQKILFFF